jgi:hypothetical protein
MLWLFMRNVCLWIEFRNSIVFVTIDKVETVYSIYHHCQMIQHKAAGLWKQLFFVHVYITLLIIQ